MRSALAQLARWRLGAAHELLLEHQAGAGGRCSHGSAALFLELGLLYGIVVG